MTGRFITNRDEGKLLGVAAGIADYTGVDPLLVRLGIIVATLIIGPIVILLYGLTGWLAPTH